MFISASRSVYLLRYVTSLLILTYHCASVEKLMIKIKFQMSGKKSRTTNLLYALNLEPVYSKIRKTKLSFAKRLLENEFTTKLIKNNQNKVKIRKTVKMEFTDSFNHINMFQLKLSILTYCFNFFSFHSTLDICEKYGAYLNRKTNNKDQIETRFKEDSDLSSSPNRSLDGCYHSSKKWSLTLEQRLSSHENVSGLASQGDYK
ncbi:hypothetical protein BpHYR1_049566 [Brachionus plicatilis]|uniref:Uncharacterized protein n=1 Tax=Brachionus plicatilis TaxID=10195 RepID=A0A3M7QCS2_BRAPC|nr:hypothetical protein BpHYR1_049566 [Brachionus plicatilis]